MNASFWMIPASLALAASACATAPRQQLTDSSAAVSAAEARDAAEHPRAAYHLALAKEQLEAAKPLVEGSRKDKQHARDLLARAEVDAQLAMSLAQSAEMQDQAKSAWDEVRELRSE